MRKFLPFLIALLGLFSSNTSSAQGVNPERGDTVYATWSGTPMAVYNNMVSADTGTLRVKWKVTASDFPRDWSDTSILGICDNNICRQNDRDTLLWNSLTSRPSNTLFTSNVINAGDTGTFDLVLDLTHASNGTHYMTCSWQAVGSSIYPVKYVTFVINKFPTETPAVEKVTNHEISMYPNPAKKEINVIYGYAQESNTICIYNIIGKIVSVYKFDGASANLNIENIPSGIYFLKFIDSKGDVVAVKKFTKED